MGKGKKVYGTMERGLDGQTLMRPQLDDINSFLNYPLFTINVL